MSTFVSTAVRAALIEAARADAHERLRAEAVVLAADDADDADDAEAAQVLRDMETLRGVGVCHLRFPRDARGHERGGVRYAVAVQSDLLPLSTWLVAPTSTAARAATSRPEEPIGLWIRSAWGSRLVTPASVNCASLIPHCA